MCGNQCAMQPLVFIAVAHQEYATTHVLVFTYFTTVFNVLPLDSLGSCVMDNPYQRITQEA